MRYVTICIDEIETTTDAAVLAVIDGDELWIPRSVIEDGNSVEEGDDDSLEVAKWFAEKEGLI